MVWHDLLSHVGIQASSGTHIRNNIILKGRVGISTLEPSSRESLKIYHNTIYGSEKCLEILSEYD